MDRELKKQLCKTASINIYNTVFPIIVLSMLLIYFVIEAFDYLDYKEPMQPYQFFSFLVIFLIVMVIVYFASINKIVRNIRVKKYGNVIRAAVVDYLTPIDGYEKIMVLSYKTQDGIKTIKYDTYGRTEPYNIGSEIELYVYKDRYLIKDSDKNLKEKRISIIIITLLSLYFIFITLIYFLPIILGVSPNQFKLSFKDNDTIRSELNELRYVIPDDYKLDGYEKNHKYIFSSRNDEHRCDIYIYSSDSNKDNSLSVDSCVEYDQVSHMYRDYDKEVINNKLWCYEDNVSDSGFRYETYNRNDGKYYYHIVLYTYYQKDEKCYMDFQNFVNNLKFAQSN